MRRSPVCPELTMRECEVLGCVVRGFTNAQIALRLTLTLTSVESHLGRIMSKLALECRVHLAVYALKSGLVALDDIDLEEVRARRRRMAV